MALENVDVWIRLSKSGKGFSVKVEDTYYVGAVSNFNRVVSGEIKGMQLSKQVNDEKTK